MQMLIAIKGEIDSNTIIVRYLNTTYTCIDHPGRKLIRKHKH